MNIPQEEIVAHPSTPRVRFMTTCNFSIVGSVFFFFFWFVFFCFLVFFCCCLFAVRFGTLDDKSPIKSSLACCFQTLYWSAVRKSISTCFEHHVQRVDFHLLQQSREREWKRTKTIIEDNVETELFGLWMLLFNRPTNITFREQPRLLAFFDLFCFSLVYK